MALDEATRERLRLNAAKNKGRTNLMGLDRTLGLIALDHVMDRDGELPKWVLRADGHLRYAQGGTFCFDVSCHYDEPARRGTHRIDCPWVRISYAPEYLKAEFAARWGKRTITYSVRGVATSAPVFPLAQVVEFFKFLWPDGKDLEARCCKYLKGYAESWVQKNPGVGSVLRATDDHPTPGMPGRVGVVDRISNKWLILKMEDEGDGEAVAAGATAIWKVVG